MGHALIVEDDADSARMVATLVGAQGFSASTAGSLQDARRLMRFKDLQRARSLPCLSFHRHPHGIQGRNTMTTQESIGRSEGRGTESSSSSSPRRSLRGFAAMDPQRQREIASLGGRAAHQSGHAHEFTSEEARAAGRKRHQKNRGQNLSNAGDTA